MSKTKHFMITDKKFYYPLRGTSKKTPQKGIFFDVNGKACVKAGEEAWEIRIRTELPSGSKKAIDVLDYLKAHYQRIVTLFATREVFMKIETVVDELHQVVYTLIVDELPETSDSLHYFKDE